MGILVEALPGLGRQPRHDSEGEAALDLETDCGGKSGYQEREERLKWGLGGVVFPCNSQDTLSSVRLLSRNPPSISFPDLP